jgi:uncharacterized protein (TIGR03437 family)
MTPRSLCVLAIALVFAILPVPAAAAVKIVLTTSSDLSTLGQPVTLTATIASGQATGRVSFYDGPAIIGSAPVGAVTAGVAALNVTLSAGSHSLRAFYLGDINFAASLSSSVSLVVFAFPQKGFLNGAAFNAGTDPIFVATADFNLDGHADLVVASAGSNSVQVLLGGGDGTFQSGFTYATGSAPVGIAIADFNGDGIPDLAVANSGSGNVSILLGGTGGTFSQAINYTLGGSPFAVVAGDFNGDGIADLVVAGFGLLSVMIGNGDGTFQAPLNYSGSASHFRSIATADFNGDGIPDLVLTNLYGATTSVSGTSVSVLIGNGDGTFQASVNYATGTQPISVAVGDFNGDGIPDLAVANFSSNSVSVLLGKGNGTFQAAVNRAVGSVPYSVAVGDFNGDGKQDLVIANNTGGVVSVLQGNGDGTFAAAINYTTGVPALVAATVGDFNGDGVSDLAVASGSNGGFVLLGVPATLATKPVINANGIVNGASFTAQSTPGFIGSLFGTNLAPANGSASAVPLPVELNGVSVSVSGYLAPLFFVSPTQINFQLPWELLGQNQVVALVAVNGTLSATQVLALRTLSPGIFSLNSAGTGQGAVQIANTAIYAATSVQGAQARPAVAGEYVTIYCSGLGDVSNRPATGAPASTSSLSNTVAAATATIGGVNAPVNFSGLSPGFVGLYQVNAQVPSGVSGNAMAVVLTIGGVVSNTVTIAVQ